MVSRLMQDTGQLLNQHLPQEADIQLVTDGIETPLADLGAILLAYDIKQRDRCVLLGSYWVLLQALRAHEQLPQDPEAAARAVLDGDFLQSFYLQFALRHQLVDLVAELATTLKRIQIRRAEGVHGNDALMIQQRICGYVANRYSRRHKNLSRFKQVTYDVI